MEIDKPRKLGVGRGFPFGMETDLQNPGFTGGLPGIAPETIRGIAKKPYRVIELNLASSRSDVEFPVVGNVIQIVEGYDTANSTPDANVNILVRLNDIGADQIPFYPGQSIGGMPFEKLYISNDAQADRRMKIFIVTDSANDRVDTE